MNRRIKPFAAAIFALTGALAAPDVSPAADAPDCGIVSEIAATANPAAKLWALRGEAVQALPGKLILLSGMHAGLELAFQESGETLVHAWATTSTTDALVTRRPRGYGVYLLAVNGAGAPLLTRVRTTEIADTADGRTLYSPLVDVWTIPGRTEIWVGGAFSAWKYNSADFLGANPQPTARLRLPTGLAADSRRPVFFVPWQTSGGSYQILVLDQAPGSSAMPTEAYRFDPYNLAIDAEPSNIQLEARLYLAKVRNRNAALARNWVARDLSLTNPDYWSGEIGLENDYVVDRLATSAFELTTGFNTGSFFSRGGEILCRAFPAGAQQATMALQDTPAGRQRVFFAVGRAGRILKMAVFENKNLLQ